MITKTYTCDKCGAESNDHQFLWKLTLTPKVAYPESQYESDPLWAPAIKSVEWCFDCCLAKGLIRPYNYKTKEEKAKQVPQPTIEEMVREMVREMAQDVIDEQ